MFNSIEVKNFFDKKPEHDPRLGLFAQAMSEEALLKVPRPNEKSFVIAGYADDRGIAETGGRLGAASAPDEIRKKLYRSTPMTRAQDGISLFDLGNLDKTQDLLGLEKALSSLMHSAFEKNMSWVGLGGGHDFGFIDGYGFLSWQQYLQKKSPKQNRQSKKHRPLIINFDAHMDVRPFEGKVTSGSPFRRLLETFEDFDFLEVGLQSQCNSPVHYKWLTERGARCLFLDEILLSGKSPSAVIIDFLQPELLDQGRPCFISIDLDVFSSAYAPGCSHVFPIGLNPADLLPVLQLLYGRTNVSTFGLYEASPKYDIDSRTMALCVQLLHSYLYA